MYKKVISKARVWVPLLQTIPRENQIVLGTYILGPREMPIVVSRGNSSGATCSGWRKEFSYLGCKEERLTKYLRRGEFIVKLQVETRGTRITAAWGSVGVASQGPRNTCVTWPHRRLRGDREPLQQQEHFVL